MSLVDEVLGHPEFENAAPVLLDIGASGKIHPRWKQIARHAVCLAFDPDSREMEYAVHEQGQYKKLIVFSKAVTAGVAGTVNFFLTRSPFCSSTLKPDSRALRDWSFGPLFEVERETELPAITLAQALSDAGIARVDWFKTDSQGTDLRLFASLGSDLLDRVLAAEFEPGILDAYQGEDKMWQVMSFMEGRPFWLARLDPRPAKRLRADFLEGLSPLRRRAVPLLLAGAPGWCEMAYLNSFARVEELTKREYLLGWVFAVLEKQYGFALQLAHDGDLRFPDPLFARLRRDAQRRIAGGCWRIPALLVKLCAQKGAAILGAGG